MEAIRENEKCFRSHLASKKYNYDDFICKGDLNGIFYKNNEFTLTKSNHLQWSTQFLKSTVRISSKLPRVLKI